MKPKNKIFFFCFFTGVASARLLAQTDSISTSRPKIEYDITFGADRLFQPQNQKIYLPTNIRNQRSQNSTLGLNFKEFTNIPQFHASVFTGILTKVNFTKDVCLYLDFYAEDRGQSFGSLKMNKVVLFPRIYGEISQTFSVLKRKINVDIEVGDLLQFKNNQGLTINNVDVQGVDIKLEHNGWWFSYALIGDVSQHVGLNIAEVYSYKIGYDAKLKNNNSFSVGGSLDYYLLNQTTSTITKPIWSLFGQFQKNRFQCFVEAGYRGKAYNGNTTDFFGALVGFELIPIKNEKTEWRFITKTRYYGKRFNKNYIEPSVRFRDPSLSIYDSNFVGEYLYPLVNTYRYFDQWSVYTEYQNTQLIATSINWEMEQKVYKELFAQLNFEGNHIIAKNQEDALYTLYSCGLKYKIGEYITFEIYATNKVMNLDIHFQTYYQSQQPIFGFSLRRIGLPIQKRQAHNLSM